MHTQGCKYACTHIHNAIYESHLELTNTNTISDEVHLEHIDIHFNFYPNEVTSLKDTLECEQIGSGSISHTNPH